MVFGSRLERNLNQQFYNNLLGMVFREHIEAIDPLISEENLDEFEMVSSKILGILQDQSLDLPNRLALMSNYLSELNDLPKEKQ